MIVIRDSFLQLPDYELFLLLFQSPTADYESENNVTSLNHLFHLDFVFTITLDTVQCLVLPLTLKGGLYFYLAVHRKNFKS